MWSHLFLALLLFTYVGAKPVQKWRGEVCSRVVARYRKERRCAYRTWTGCLHYKKYWVPYYTTGLVCCKGWRHSGDFNCNDRISARSS